MVKTLNLSMKLHLWKLLDLRGVYLGIPAMGIWIWTENLIINKNPSYDAGKRLNSGH